MPSPWQSAENTGMKGEIASPKKPRREVANAGRQERRGKQDDTFG